ncbi:MAG: hypothetical protein ACKV0T_25795 [Planctomycetales bacterium]
MTQIVLDRNAVEKLAGRSERVEICDDQGRRIGYFEPDPSGFADCQFTVPFSTEELRRARLEPVGRTLPEILADLDKHT